MNYIIDGHNLIGKTPGLNLSMPDDEQKLIELLIRFSRDSRHKLEVYFDGAPGGQAGMRNYGRVRAYFVPSSSSADDAIRLRLRRLGKSAANWMVVSSDRSVQAAAHEFHARVLSADDFARQIQAILQTAPKEEDDFAGQPLSEAEVNEWLEIFKERDKEKPHRGSGQP
jgi:predicted RNA-binding protein with PIN domain